MKAWHAELNLELRTKAGQSDAAERLILGALDSLLARERFVAALHKSEAKSERASTTGASTTSAGRSCSPEPRPLSRA
jgi:hypothetical protein